MWLLKKNIMLASVVGILSITMAGVSVNAEVIDAEKAKSVKNYRVTISKKATTHDIQSAINKAYRKGGGIVTLSAVTYELDEPIQLKSNVTLTGNGREKTILKKADDLNIPEGQGVLYSQGGLENAIVKKLTVDGNADTVPDDKAPANGIYGLLVIDTNGKGNNKVLFSEFGVKNASMGFHVKGTENLVVRNSDFSYNGGYYLYYHNLYLRRVYRANLYNCIFSYSTSGNGVNISYSEDIKLESCTSYSNYFRGIRASDSQRIDIINCDVYRNKTGDGIVMIDERDGVKDFQIKDCRIANNGKYGINLTYKSTDGEIWNNVDGGGNLAGYINNVGTNNSILTESKE